ncbi:MAG: TIGR02117 family protein [Sphingobacteriales bacterium]|nr:MAG: TIGR02117 family protein [Sphingobacteriales bacterium]
MGSAFVLSRIGVNKDAAQKGSKDVTIYIKTNGVHTDIVVPYKNDIKDWSEQARLDDTDAKNPEMQWASIGWGDKGFYLQTPEWSDLKFSVAFKAMFHLGTSALHVTFFKQMQTGERCKEIKISWEQYAKLVAFIDKSFLYDASGKTINIPSRDDGYGSDDAFYESPYVYDLFHTCNTWANNALKACDQRACLWTPSDKGIFYQYRDR